MREIVKGEVYADGLVRYPTGQKLHKGKLGGPVLILPIEDGKVGDFEQKWIEFLCDYELHNNAHMNVYRQIATAISRLFEEVESED